MPKLSILKILVICMVVSLTTCILLSYLYKMPSPLVGDTGKGMPFSHAFSVGFMAWVFYGIFFFAILLSAIQSFIISKVIIKITSIDRLNEFYVLYIPAILLSIGWPLLLANLELIIGTW